MLACERSRIIHLYYPLWPVKQKKMQENKHSDKNHYSLNSTQNNMRQYCFGLIEIGVISISLIILIQTNFFLNKLNTVIEFEEKLR